MTTIRHAQLIAWLEDQGHGEEEISQILTKLDEYDERTLHESVFDSIDSGKLNLVEIIKEALAGAPGKP